MATNILEQVQTYQMSSLALLSNLNCFIGTSNTKFKNFDNLTANLGDTVTFDLPPRFVTEPSLVAVFQDSQQRAQPLTVDQSVNTSYEFTDQEFIFNVEDYMERFGKSAVGEIGSVVEGNVAQNALTNTYRVFGDGVTPINSYTQLADAIARFRNYGAAPHDTYGYLPDVNVPAIIGSGLSQFATNRNNEIANSWMLGEFDTTKWCRSNLLPVHTAGDVGQNAQQLTFVSINAAGDQLTMSGATASTVNALVENDKLVFETDIRYLTFQGHLPSANPVSVRVTANVDSDGGGTVVIPITPALISTVGSAERNLTRPLAITDTAVVLPSRRSGMICSGKALYLAMPRLPNQTPFPTSSEHDPDTGISMRMYYGAQFGQNQRGFINDIIWGSTLVPEYAMELAFPL